MRSKIIRFQEKSIKHALKHRRIVILSGARQTGKTTLVQQIVGKDMDYRTLDDTFLLTLAKEDPKGFVRNTVAKTMVIDEIQKAPNLIPEIKILADRNNRNGQFLLTGSANLKTLPSVTESLAGRVKNIRLRPLTMSEISSAKPLFLEKAFNKNFPLKVEGFGKSEIMEIAFRGGFPEVIRLKKFTEQREWHKDYLITLLEHDLREIANIKRQNALKELLGVLASWSAKYMDAAAIGSSLSLNKLTLDSYINALVSLYLFEQVPPWLKTDYDRVGRRAKFYATDTGLMASILGWNKKDALLNHDRAGKLIETFVFQEIAAQIDLENASLYHYRDRENREIDFIIEREGGALLGIEVKAGHNVSKEDFKHLEWFSKNLAKDNFTGIVLYSGDRTIHFSKNMLAVPTAMLWAKL
ncbi:MAG: ATP-binding protein [Fibromonadaceae bacterium]|jgi:predicted AAA+ superfamily ATPase|nr:ATP-binding protein [Fibromonadaceae bacterium]